MKKTYVFMVTLLMVFYFIHPCGTEAVAKDFDAGYSLGKATAERALLKLGQVQEDKLLVITNAGYVRTNEVESSPALDAIQDLTGVSAGRGNLLSLHSAPDRPLFFFFYDSAKGAGYYLETEYDGRSAGNVRFTKERYETAFASLTERGKEFDALTKDKAMGGNEFRLLMLTSLWLEGMPMEMRNAVEYHDHFCPGLASGLYIIEFLRKRFPLAEGESYYIIASPPWCKDDALQMILNATVGKRAMAVIPLDKKDIDCLIGDAKKAAGIYFKRSRTKKSASGLVLGFDWNKLRNDAGLPATSEKASPAEVIQLAKFMARHLKDYAKYTSSIKELKLDDGEMPEDYVRPGVNPWRKAGLWKEKCGQ